MGGRRLAAGLLGGVALVLGHRLVWEELAFPAFDLEGAWRLLGTVALVAAVIPPGPRGAMRALGRARTAVLALGAAALGALHLITYLSQWPRMPSVDLPLLRAEQWLELGFGLGLVLLLGAALRPGPVGRFSGVLLACPLAFYLVEILRQATPLDPNLREHLWEHGVPIGFALTAAVMVATVPLTPRRTPG